MVHDFTDDRRGLIERLIKYIAEKLPEDESPLIKDFLRYYYLRVSPEDLGLRSVIDLYGAVVSHWNFIYQRKPGESKVCVYNPNQEQHGWQSSHTVIEVITDDKPFIVDSIRLALTRGEYNIHLLIHLTGMCFKRDVFNNIIAMADAGSKVNAGFVGEAPIYIEINRQSDPKVLAAIKASIESVIKDVDIIVEHWQPMKAKIAECIQILLGKTSLPPPLAYKPATRPLTTATAGKTVSKTAGKAKGITAKGVKIIADEYQVNGEQDLAEIIEFLQWIVEDHFTFLGFARYQLIGTDETAQLDYIENSGLGLYCKAERNRDTEKLQNMAPSARAVYLSKQILLLGKTNVLSTIHRPTYEDFIGVKVYAANGVLQEEWRFIGLYTAVAYNSSPREIPFIRRKIDQVFTLSGFKPNTYDGRAVLNILENIPRDDLLHAAAHELQQLAIGILFLQERQKITLFIRRDLFGKYYSCLVFVPRDRFNSTLRLKMQNILLAELKGYSVDFSTKFSESILARIHFIVRVNPLDQVTFIIADIEKKLAEAGRTWNDDLYDALHESYGEEKATEYLRYYSDAFPTSYCENFSARNAVVDIEHIEELLQQNDTALAMSLYRPIEDKVGTFRFKLFRQNKPFPLSDVVPMLENMGLRIISERPYNIQRKDNGKIWINDYRMVLQSGKTLSPELVKDIFQDAFAAVWYGRIENDGFNRLVLSALLNWREVAVLRGYFKYLWQTGLGFSQRAVEEALFNNSQLAKLLIQYFYDRFDPTIALKASQKDNNDKGPRSEDKPAKNKFKQAILQGLDEVASLNEDRIIRKYQQVIQATLRTNFFQVDAQGAAKGYLAFKCKSAAVPDLPKPRPLYEIFVYSPRIEGIHLRGAKVARGGVRWSDRHEDFRTEILGLMKAQQVKNAVIVPMGAKGGFVVKTNMSNASRDEVLQEGVACYQIFIHGLLDITDNLCQDEVIVPPNVVRYDEDDPYLVVAADKGTATFSDIANAISAEYNFWLGDAFASGSSTGYDHKKMGITARGVWESVKMHFLDLDINIDKTPFTVIGIGDMSGDVFGNGLLLSRNIKLVAAFNHQHIFLDPNPDPEKSFLERERLFQLPRSSWADYNRELIAKGGGVFARSDKNIKLSTEIKELLDLDIDNIVPNDLIKAILTAKVDLLWNGGIGTFVKASNESNQDVGDRSNDGIRITAPQLRCKVVAEGGNLGLTQLARIEYATLGGIVNTDAIDNSAGVNCSDNEVNIKILLNDVVNAGDLTMKQRNELLVEMQAEVAELVLANNRRQNEAITIAELQAANNLEMHHRLMKILEKTAGLDRAIEFLPDKEEILTRKSHKQGLTRPELAILLAYAKILLKKDLLSSQVLEDAYLLKELISAFPTLLRERFQNYMTRHRLKREILATQITNAIIDEMGMNFVSRLHDETGAPTADIVSSYMIAKEVFNSNKLRADINKLNGKISHELLMSMLQELNRLIRRTTRWFIRNRRGGMDIAYTIGNFAPKVREIQDNLMDFLIGDDLQAYQDNITTMIGAKVTADLANIIGTMPAMYSSLDIVEAAMLENLSVLETAKVYFAIGAKLELRWFRDLIKQQAIRDNWEALARAAFRDDLDRQQRSLTIAILQAERNKATSLQQHVDTWLDTQQGLLSRWQYFVTELKSSAPDFTMFAVALRELLELSRGLYQSTK